MDEKIIDRIVFPEYWKGVVPNHVGCQRNIYLHAFDTETWLGRVYLTGFYDRRGFQKLYGLHKDHFRWFIERCNALGRSQRKNYCHIVAAHNLKYDLGVLIWKILNPLSHSLPSQGVSRFSYLPLKAEIYISWKRPCFAKIKFRQGKAVVTVIDTFAYFNTSLKRVLKMLGGQDQKLETPENIGHRIVPQKEILPYNRADCVGVYRILEFLEERHRAYDIRFSVSLPQMSSRIFRHRFLKAGFVKPPPGAIYAGLCSYHGGKNTWIGEQGWHQAYDLDIRSAFPEAMVKMPNFCKGNWIKSSTLSDKPGFYFVTGNLKTCKWGSLFSHGFKIMSGTCPPTWVTSYELLESIRSNEFHGKILDGWVFVGDGKPSPFKSFVENFFKEKEEAQTKIKREFFKLTLNALYGKFIQKTEDEITGELKVGGLFDPCVASLITGFVRARIHFLEHKYKALHTATDGILTTKHPDPRDLGGAIGQLKQENFGPVLILRNKLYLHYKQDGTLFKRGLHGFQGKPEELFKMWQEKRKYYKVERLVSWAESWGMGIPPGGPLERKMICSAIG